MAVTIYVAQTSMCLIYNSKATCGHGLLRGKMSMEQKPFRLWLLARMYETQFLFSNIILRSFKHFDVEQIIPKRHCHSSNERFNSSQQLAYALHKI